MMTMMRRVATVVAAVAVTVPLLAVPASGHGYTQDPTSRARWCQMGMVSACGGAQYEPQSIEGPKGFPGGGPRDGQICSAGNSRFAELDDPSKNWPLTEVSGGSEFDFTWTITASHKTTKWEYFITKDNWNPDEPLTRRSLEDKPFFTEPSDGQSYPPKTVTHTGVIPDNKYGRHLILGVWEIADTGNSFYSCADVNIN